MLSHIQTCLILYKILDTINNKQISQLCIVYHKYNPTLHLHSFSVISHTCTYHERTSLYTHIFPRFVSCSLLYSHSCLASLSIKFCWVIQIVFKFIPERNLHFLFCILYNNSSTKFSSKVKAMFNIIQSEMTTKSIVKVWRLKLYLSRQKWTIDKTIIFFKNSPLGTQHTVISLVHNTRVQIDDIKISQQFEETS